MALDPSRPEFQRVYIEPRNSATKGTEFVAYTTGFQRSSRLISMKSANGLIHLPSGVENPKLSLEAGSLVKAFLLQTIDRSFVNG